MTPANPNGSLRAIAGVINAAGNVAGLMPHPERAAEAILGSDDGLAIIRSLVDERRGAPPTGARAMPAVGRGADDRSTEPPVAEVGPRSRSTGGWAHRRGARRDPRPRSRPRPERPRARDVQRHVERALLLQVSKPLLRTLPTAGEGVIAGPGEQAGVISIGDGLAVAFKIESHNHPSAVEPYQGAATGVGGILRDIFTMGARPIAVLDALRFGDPADARTRHLVDGVVRGVGGYGNCVGVPTVGGELVFDPTYQANPLVNVMAIGLLEERL